MTLSSQAIERMNTHELTAELMARGWAIYLPVYDDGIDMLATQNDVQSVIRIQLKSRWTISKKYVGRNIEIAFRDHDEWYVAPHESMVVAGELEGYCKRPSWTKGGEWSVRNMSKSLANRMASFKLDNRIGKSLIAKL